MSMQSPTESPPPAREVSLWERVPLVFTSPLAAFEAVRERPGWWLPGLIVLVLVGLFTAVNLHIVMPENLERQLAFEEGAAQREMLEQQYEMFVEPPAWLRLLSGIGGGIGAWLVLLVPGLIYHLFLKLSEGRAPVGQTLGVVYWAGLVPFGLKTVVSWALIVATGSATTAQATGATIFFTDLSPQSLTYLLAAFFGDVFMIWNIVLLVFGFAVVHGIGLQRAAVVTVAVYVLISAAQIGLALLPGVIGGGAS